MAWRLGWSPQESNPVLWVALLLAEAYGCWNLVMLAWMTWDIRTTAAAHPGPACRCLYMHLQRAGCRTRSNACGLCAAELPAHDLRARRRSPRRDRRRGRPGLGRALPDAPGQLAREGRQHQPRAEEHRRRTSCSCSMPTTCPCLTRWTRSSATSTRSPARARAEPARLLQPRLRPALRPRAPRAVGLLRGDLPRQLREPPGHNAAFSVRDTGALI